MRRIIVSVLQISGSRSRSAGHSDSTVMTCSESGDSSVASASAVGRGGSGTSSGRPSKVKKYSSLTSLLCRKRGATETVDAVTKKSKEESAKSVARVGLPDRRSIETIRDVPNF